MKSWLRVLGLCLTIFVAGLIVAWVASRPNMPTKGEELLMKECIPLEK